MVDIKLFPVNSLKQVCQPERCLLSLPPLPSNDVDDLHPEEECHDGQSSNLTNVIMETERGGEVSPHSARWRCPLQGDNRSRGRGTPSRLNQYHSHNDLYSGPLLPSLKLLSPVSVPLEVEFSVLLNNLRASRSGDEQTVICETPTMLVMTLEMTWAQAMLLLAAVLPSPPR